MDAQRDAVLIMIGLPSTRVAALAAGSVDATIAIPPDNVLLRQKGFRELLFLGDAIEFPSNGFTTTERQLNEKRDLTKRLLRALYRGLIFARERPEDIDPDPRTGMARRCHHGQGILRIAGEVLQQRRRRQRRRIESPHRARFSAPTKPSAMFRLIRSSTSDRLKKSGER